MEQRSYAWHQARLGHITASRAHVILSEPRSKKDREAGVLGAQALSYAYELLAERITGQAKQVSSPAMQWGTDWEPVARECCAVREGWDILEPVDEFAFVSRHGWVGASPDGIVGADGLVEIQCPYTAEASVRTRIEGYAASGKSVQMQFQMWQTNRKWCQFVSFDERFPDPYYGELVERDDKFIATLEAKVLTFRDRLLEMYSQLTGVPF